MQNTTNQMSNFDHFSVLRRENQSLDNLFWYLRTNDANKGKSIKLPHPSYLMGCKQSTFIEPIPKWENQQYFHVPAGVYQYLTPNFFEENRVTIKNKQSCPKN